MDNKVLEDIKNYAIQRLKREYGYCGAAEAPNLALLNSGGGSEEITIRIDCEKEKDDG